MLSRIFGRLGCLVGKHHRSKRLTRESGDKYVSRCRYCRKPMERSRVSDRRWRVTRGTGPQD
jgi:hypothetical protein